MRAALPQEVLGPLKNSKSSRNLSKLSTDKGSCGGNRASSWKVFWPRGVFQEAGRYISSEYVNPEERATLVSIPERDICQTLGQSPW